jgi:hypothetical protein
MLCFKETLGKKVCLFYKQNHLILTNDPSAQIVTMTIRMEAKENTINIKGDGFFNIKHLMVSKT